jgi:hypothetical protein
MASALARGATSFERGLPAGQDGWPDLGFFLTKIGKEKLGPVVAVDITSATINNRAIHTYTVLEARSIKQL